jgi:hypothetical protein
MGKLSGGRAAVGLGLLLGVVLLAGCSASGGSGAATTTTSAQQAAAAVLREFVRCARANGMPNLPDLQLDSNGQVSIPEGTPPPPKSVERACRSIWERLPASARGEEARPPADMQALLRYARVHARARHAGLPRPVGRRQLPGAAQPAARGQEPQAPARHAGLPAAEPEPEGRCHVP